jgi:hypothetical protein
MTKPVFLGIGVQKGGTTWLHETLKMHASVFLPTPKELMFFDNAKHFRKGMNWYISHFQHSAPHQIAGEITPGYFWVADAPPHDFDHFRRGIPRRVKEALGSEVKLIVLLRNPIDRAISAYFHHIKKGRSDFTNPARDVLKKFGILPMGLYHRHLQCWREFFQEKNFHIATTETMKLDRTAYLIDIADFLGLPGAPPDVQERQFQRTFDYRRTEEGVIVQTETQTFTPIKKDDIAFMREYYAADVTNLSKLLPNIDLGWIDDFDTSTT